MRDMLVVDEIFRSLQGESTRAGLPCGFVRLAGCDLGCDWCDTRRAWDMTGRTLPLEEVLDAVRDLGEELVCLTGGEPLLQEAAPALARRLADDGHTVLVETNGARDISVLPAPVIRIMDIKCPSSGASGKTDWYNLSRLRPADELKFVIADRADYEYAREIIEKHALAGRGPLLFSPVRDRLDAGELGDWVLWDCLPVRVQVQLHKVLWPDRDRGA